MHKRQNSFIKGSRKPKWHDQIKVRSHERDGKNHENPLERQIRVAITDLEPG